MRYRQLLFIFTISIITLVSHPILNQAYALVAPGIIGIELSTTCITDLKNHLFTSCPSYDKLLPYDHSIKQISGKFVTNPYFHRDSSNFKSECAYYKFYKISNVTIVDPSQDLLTNCQIKQIIIEPSDFTYVNYLDLSKTQKDYLTFSKSRIIDSCNEAHIVYSPFLLNDTISYLENGCSKTNFNSTVYTQQHQTFTDIKKSHDYINQSWIQNVKVNSSGNCIWIKCNVTDPYSKWQH